MTCTLRTSEQTWVDNACAQKYANARIYTLRTRPRAMTSPHEHRLQKQPCRYTAARLPFAFFFPQSFDFRRASRHPQHNCNSNQESLFHSEYVLYQFCFPSKSFSRQGNHVGRPHRELISPTRARPNCQFFAVIHALQHPYPRTAGNLTLECEKSQQLRINQALSPPKWNGKGTAIGVWVSFRCAQR